VERLSDTLLNWASILDDETRRQAERAASLPFVHPHVALMPDAHLGNGAEGVECPVSCRESCSVLRTGRAS
jgi:hypothetical protein